MGNLVFQATLGGQVNLVGPNTASTYNLNVPAVSSTLATTTGTETLTNKTLTSATLTNPTINGFTGDTSIVNIGSGQFYKDTGGNVGIGTSSPTSIAGYSSLTLNGTTSGLISVKYNGTDGGYIYADSSSFNIDSKAATPNLVFKSNGSEKMLIDSSGNVGIGTSSPASYGKLAVNSADNSQALVAYSTSGAVRIIPWVTGSSAAHLEGVNAAQSAYVPLFINAYSLSLGTGGTERARIDVPGNFYFNSGYGSVAVAYGCRAWVNFAGNGTIGTNQTIRASGNVSSVGHSATGRFEINFATALPDANYAVAGTAAVTTGSYTAGDNNVITPYINTTSTCTIAITDGSSNTNTNPALACVQITR